MSEQTLGPKSVKRASRDLQEVLAEVGIDAALGTCREAVTKLLGMKNWDTLLGVRPETAPGGAQPREEGPAAFEIGPHPACVTFSYRFNCDGDDGFSRTLEACFTRADIEHLVELHKTIQVPGASARARRAIGTGDDLFEDLHINIDRDGDVWLDDAHGLECLAVPLKEIIKASHPATFYFVQTDDFAQDVIELHATTRADAEDEVANHNFGNGFVCTKEELEDVVLPGGGEAGPEVN